jgi:hypothetical protein
MKVAIMQPYFMPYIGYISLIKHSDVFILFDPVQFIRHGWIERNRILKQNEGWLYTGSIIKKRKRHSDSGLSDRQFKGLEKQNFVSITDLQKKHPIITRPFN